MPKHIFKIIIFGPGAGGKTSYALRILTSKFLTDLKITIGVDFYTRRFKRRLPRQTSG